MLTKQQLRRAVLDKLRALPPKQVADGSARLRELLAPYWGSPMNVCLYVPLAHEVNLLPLLTEHPENRYYFPRCLPGRQLSFHLVHDPATELVAGTLGIPAPRPELPSLPPEQAHLIIVPGVAFTLDGKRLGYGGGYYDRYLPLCPQARSLSLALPEQLLDDLPMDSHDCRLSQVLHL